MDFTFTCQVKLAAVRVTNDVENVENKLDLTNRHYEKYFKVMHRTCTLHSTGIAFQHFVVVEIAI